MTARAAILIAVIMGSATWYAAKSRSVIEQQHLLSGLLADYRHADLALRQNVLLVQTGHPEGHAAINEAAAQMQRLAEQLSVWSPVLRSTSPRFPERALALQSHARQTRELAQRISTAASGVALGTHALVRIVDRISHDPCMAASPSAQLAAQRCIIAALASTEGHAAGDDASACSPAGQPGGHRTCPAIEDPIYRHLLLLTEDAGSLAGDVAALGELPAGPVLDALGRDVGRYEIARSRHLMWATLGSLGVLLLASLWVLALISRLRQSARALQEANRTLDERVRSRTAELSEANARLQYEARRAEAASEAKSRFLANMSHEIRTPLNGVIGLAELLWRSEREPQRRAQLGMLHESGELLLNLVSDVLDFSKIEADKVQLDPAPVAIAALLESAVFVHRKSADSKNLELRLALAPTVPAWIEVDGLRLRQLVHNLTANAIKFTGSGSVEVACAVDAAQDKEWLEISVTDTGIGISREQQAALFNPFTQADSSTTRRYGGTGLGLAISKGIVERMGGSIRVDSEAGQGAHFCVRIPLVRCSAPAAAESGFPDAQGPELGSARELEDAARSLVLVAEDNPINQAVICGMLHAAGYRTRIACDGAAAVAEAQDPEVAAILVDWQMPVMDGLEATRRIRAQLLGTGRKLPIVGVSAHASLEDKASALQAGMDAYLTKPLQRIPLEKLLQTLLGAQVPGSPNPRAAMAPQADDSQASVSRQAAPFDSETIAMLRELETVEGSGFLAGTLNRFVLDAQKRADAMEQAASTRDFAALRAAAHALKGSSASVAATGLHDLCERILELAESQAPDASGCFVRLRSELRRAAEAVPGLLAVDEHEEGHV